MIHVQCKTCGKWAVVGPREDYHEAIDRAGCVCCSEDHHHGQNANQCSGANGVGHQVVDGSSDAVIPCGVGVPGCTACRSIAITMLAGTAPVSPVGM
jgi:hypothetical protein